MIKWDYEFKVERCPSEMMRVGTVDGWVVATDLLEKMLASKKRDGYTMQDGSVIEPHGVLIFMKSTRKDIDDWAQDTVERLDDLDIYADPDFDPNWQDEVIIDPEMLKRITRAVLRVAP